MLQQGIQFSPASREPYILLAEMLIDAGLFQDALEVLNQMPTGAEGAPALLAALCQDGLGHIDQARALAELALQLAPDSAGALHLNGSLAGRRGESAAAERFFRAGIAADPGFGPCYTALSAIAWDRGARDEGLNLAETGFVLSPLDMSTLGRYHGYATELALLGREEGRVREARAIFPEHQALAFGLIEVLIRRNSFPEAMGEIERAAVDFGMNDAMLDAALGIRERIGVKAPRAGRRPTVSLCMIVKDEARHLAAALLSAGPLVDDIVVVDTGSSDRSADIARVFGARLFSFPWNGSFSDARNVSLSKALGDWILVIDADEVLAPPDLSRLATLIKKGAAPAGYSFTTRNYTEEITRRNWTSNAGEYPEEERGLGWTPSDKVRLFPNDSRIRFEGAVHELLETSLEGCGIPILPCDVPVHHYGKLDAAKCAEKQERYYLLGVKKLSESGGNLAALTELARQATELKRFQEAERLWHQLLQARPESAEAYFNLGYLHLAAGDYLKAHTHALRGAELAPEMKEAAFNLAKCELYLGHTEQALAGCREMLRQWPDYPPALSLLSVSSLILGSTGEAEAVVEGLRRRHFDCGDFLQEYADGLNRGGRGDLAATLQCFAARIAAEAGGPGHALP
jgi:tetratricopeptide (TPR) repeat protein